MNYYYFIYCLILFWNCLIKENFGEQKKCVPKHYLNIGDISCVCNSTYCDEFPPLGNLSSNHAAIYVSSKSGKRFQKTIISFNKKQFFKEFHSLKIIDADIVIDTNKKYQSIIGFGGAFTDAAGINLNKLSDGARLNLLKSYYSKEGIEYSLGRVPIASTDFSTYVYSYCDVENDFKLKNFGLVKDDFQFKIPHIKTALSMKKLNIFASPWSAPAWMKVTNKMTGGGILKGKFNEQYYITWAYYFIRFFEEYLRQGIQFWGLTLQNEPSVGIFKNFPWQALYFTPEMQRDYISTIFGPFLKSNNITKNLKIIIHDDQRYLLPANADVILQDKNAAKFVDGIGVHWYGDSFVSARRLSKTHEFHPNKFILPTEACSGFYPWFSGPFFGNWKRGEDYAYSIIEDLQNWAAGWTDWNICLNEEGGPNFAKNFVDSPIIVNSTIDEFYKQPMYYALGHFSKFLQQGSVRIGINIKVFGLLTDSKLNAVAFFNTDQKIVLIILNRQSNLGYKINIKTNNKTFSYLIGPNSINTIVWNFETDLN